MLEFRPSRWCTPDSDWEVKSVTPHEAPLHRTTPTNGLQRGDCPPTRGRRFRAALPSRGIGLWPRGVRRDLRPRFSVVGSTPKCIRRARPEPGLGLASGGVVAPGSNPAAWAPATNGAIPDLLKDPSMNTDSAQARPAPADAITAIPWLTNDEESRAMPTPDPLPHRFSPCSCAKP